MGERLIQEQINPAEQDAALQALEDQFNPSIIGTVIPGQETQAAQIPGQLELMDTNLQIPEDLQNKPAATTEAAADEPVVERGYKFSDNRTVKQEGMFTPATAKPIELSVDEGLTASVNAAFAAADETSPVAETETSVATTDGPIEVTTTKKDGFTITDSRYNKKEGQLGFTKPAAPEVTTKVNAPTAPEAIIADAPKSPADELDATRELPKVIGVDAELTDRMNQHFGPSTVLSGEDVDMLFPKPEVSDPAIAKTEEFDAIVDDESAPKPRQAPISAKAPKTGRAKRLMNRVVAKSQERFDTRMEQRRTRRAQTRETPEERTERRTKARHDRAARNAGRAVLIGGNYSAYATDKRFDQRF
jgi:hypothetical protein